MRILFVAMANSIHVARWINQLVDQGWDIHLFAIDDFGIHPDLRNVTVHNYLYRKSANATGSVRVTGSWPFRRGVGRAQRIALRVAPAWREQVLAATIRRLKPDIIHSLEIQHASYLTLAARDRLGGKFPTWIITNWGSDIYLFGRLAEHVDKIKAVLAACDYYSCECQRDVQLAKNLGFRGEVLPVVPNTGGFHLARISQFRQPGPTSSRRLILLKGYQHWAGRALVGLRAIELCANELRGYRVAIYMASPEVNIAAELVSQSTDIPIEVIPPCTHDDMLRWYGSARIYIGLSISDAISTSLLEAMVMGAFPIQSCTACVDEWVVDGKTGSVVPPEDPETVAAAIRRAVADDALVDYAARQNAKVAAERLDYSVIQAQVSAMYERVAAQTASKQGSKPVHGSG